ncbi:YkoF family thiamine/hydroxymethylpyrimidine-binding protein [Echinimonas agarilytica]|uniref:Thiamin/hydroxymethyl pyrimidine-binding YkoF putative domain-containing protein n=1 Tax=Echinimonas agarilytica TaxID=1215918 RepID=A0AA42B9F8_9GAMM|nr:YkoF family thiamine/hydroxymethylpyrimidine-binding protein [Echinimonas agarilytica]MCM2681383.1 hypothetical protein [Echinimonas agarilytica]
MQLTVDISMYPLKDDFITPITWFIERVATYPTIQRKTNALATQIVGPYDDVMKMLSNEMKASHEKFGQAVFVCKFLCGARELDFDDTFGQTQSDA